MVQTTDNAAQSVNQEAANQEPIERPWMIYGANGYTGEIAARTAAARGQSPILAGRNEAKIKPLAEELGLPWRVFDLQRPDLSVEALADVDLVLHCAGPFSATSRPMVNACLNTGTHYLDITGEISVFESIHQRDSEARKAGVILMPGVGFDVVPSDCLAATLHEKLPDATHLSLAFCGDGGLSPGTSKTMIENAANRGKVRRDGYIVSVPTGYKRRAIRFSDRERWAMTIPWGDVSTAYYSTGIANIEVYTAVPKRASVMARLSSPAMGILGIPALQNMLKNLVEKRVTGPDEATRQRGRMFLWGQASNARGERCEAELDVPEGYSLTVLASLESARRILTGQVKQSSGSLTPSMGFGADFITSFEETALAWR